MHLVRVIRGVLLSCSYGNAMYRHEGHQIKRMNVGFLYNMVVSSDNAYVIRKGTSVITVFREKMEAKHFHGLCTFAIVMVHLLRV